MAKETPGKVAKDWAKANADKTGVVWVMSLAPKGRGGRRGMCSRSTKFYVRGGQAAQTRERRYDGEGNWNPQWNGRCHVCGEFYLETVIARCWTADPEAGKPTTGNLAGYGWRYEISPHAWVVACPDCREQHGLQIGEKPKYCRVDSTERVERVERAHPLLTRYPGDGGEELARIDLITPRAEAPEQ